MLTLQLRGRPSARRSVRRLIPLWLGAKLALVATAAVGQPAPQPASLPIDRATTMGGVEMACTGIGETRADPRWAAYNVRVEFSNGKNEYLGGGAVRVRNTAGGSPIEVSCDGPWILMRLTPGRYRIDGWQRDLPVKSRSADVRPPRTGQTRIVLQFPDA